MNSSSLEPSSLEPSSLEQRQAFGAAEKDAPVLHIDIRKRFDKSKSGFELCVRANLAPEITIVFGPSGAGKTTLLECVAGLLAPTAGEIQFQDKCWYDGSRKFSLDVRQRNLGYVFQELALFPHLSLRRNVEYGIRSLDPSHREQRMTSILQSFRIEHLGGRKPGELSGGERQRAALARALVTHPSMLLLDEPLTALDDPTKAGIIDDMRAWNAERHIPILYVTHSREEASALGNCVLRLEAGKMVALGPPREVLPAR